MPAGPRQLACTAVGSSSWRFCQVCSPVTTYGCDSTDGGPELCRGNIAASSSASATAPNASFAMSAVALAQRVVVEPQAAQVAKTLRTHLVLHQSSSGQMKNSSKLCASD